LHCLAGDNQFDESEAAESAVVMNGWSNLATNKDTPVEFYFASDARFVKFL